MADQLLTALFNAGIAISIGATVLSLGMTFTIPRWLSPLRRVWLVVTMVVLSAAVVPVVAWGIATALPINDAYVDELVIATLGAGSAGANIVVSARVVFRHALERDEIDANPASGLRLPNNIGRRERAASPSEAAELLVASPDKVRTIYATAFYAGLRRGEPRRSAGTALTSRTA